MQPIKLAMYGTGRVGKAVKELAESVGIEVAMVDDNTETFDAADFDIVVPSPGVPPHKLPGSRAYGENSLSECEFAFSYLPKGWKILSITGTDGKSTTAWILYKLLVGSFGEDRVHLSGNFEIPLSETVRIIREKECLTGTDKSNSGGGLIVLEVSSFMSYNLGKNLHLLGMLPKITQSNGFRSEVGILTNFAPDHLNWHNSLTEYFFAKLELLKHSEHCLYHSSITKIVQGESLLEIDFGALSNNHTKTSSNSDKSNSDNGSFTGIGLLESLNNPIEFTVTDEDAIYGGYNSAICQLKDTHFRGRHNVSNIEASLIACKIVGAEKDTLVDSLKQIEGLPHRLQKIEEMQGVTFVDDSKSTSAQSLRVALESYPENKSVILIAGGSDKGDSFDSLAPVVEKRCKMIVCIGATKEKFVSLANLSNIPSVRAEDMEEAVACAWNNATTHDTVLLSPGCASFGLFANYLERAEKFHQAVTSLKHSHE